MKLRIIPVATIVALLVVATAGQEGDDVVSTTTTTTTQPEQHSPEHSDVPANFVHSLKPGEREYLSPNLIGVQNIAMSFLPLTMNFVNIIDAYREIVNGVRYEMLLNAVDTKDNDAEVICQLIILEKPWLRTEWGDKVRELTYTNCSSPANDADNLTDPAARANALNDKYEKNNVFNGGSRNELSDDALAKLMAQIIPASSKLYPSGGKTKTTTTTTTTTTTEMARLAADEGWRHDNDESETTLATNDGDDNQDKVAATSIAETQLTRAQGTTTQSSPTSAEPAVLSEDEMKWLDGFFSLGALKFEATQQQQQQQEHDVGTENEATPPTTDAFTRRNDAADVKEPKSNANNHLEVITSTATALMDSDDNYDGQKQQQEAWQIAVADAA